MDLKWVTNLPAAVIRHLGRTGVQSSQVAVQGAVVFQQFAGYLVVAHGDGQHGRYVEAWISRGARGEGGG